MRHWKLSLTLTWLLTLLSITAVLAQGTCSTLIDEALDAVGENCDGLDRNNACYGFDLVQAAFLEEVAEDYFAEPADTASILDLETIATAALDETTGTWGVALMSIQANVPNTLPGQNVTFVLMGDTEIENAVNPDDAFQLADGIEIQVVAAQGANIRSGPGTNFNVIGSAASNSTVLADAQSADGSWFRIAYRERVAWINEVVLADTTPLSDLPIITPELRTAMQAFYLRTGIGQTDCADAPDDILIIQGPENIDIELTINGANVELGSTIGVHTPMIDDEMVMEIITYDGNVFVEGVQVPVGYQTRLCLEASDDPGLDGEANAFEVACEPSEPEPVEGFGEAWCVLENIPTTVLNYDIEVLCPGETPPSVPQQPAPPSIPQAESTQEVEPENVPETTNDNSQLAEVDCSTFQLVGPFSNITPRPTLFTWTEAPGATDYEIVFYNVNDNFVAGTFFTHETSIGVMVGEVPTGGTLAWEVRAYRDGAYACVTGRTQPIPRAVDPGDGSVPAGAGFNASLSCSYDESENSVANINWSGAEPNDTVRASGQDGEGISRSASGNGQSGSMSMSGYGSISGISVSTSSGDSVSLGSCG